MFYAERFYNWLMSFINNYNIYRSKKHYSIRIVHKYINVF